MEQPVVGLLDLAAEIEGQCVRWIAQFLGYRTDCGGLMVSGGNVANMVGFFAARRAMLGEAIREDGVAGAGRACVYASAETHTWLQKAADLSGLGTGAIRWVSAGPGQRMDTAALRRQIRADRDAGCRPFMAVATAGTVSTGAVDDLATIGAICRVLSPSNGSTLTTSAPPSARRSSLTGSPANSRNLPKLHAMTAGPMPPQPS